MRYSSVTSAWVFSQPKTAALYFDKVNIFVDRVLEDSDDVATLRDLGGKPLDGVDHQLGTISAPGVFLLNPIMRDVQEGMVREWFRMNEVPFPELELNVDDPLYEIAKSILVTTLAVESGVSGKGSLLLPSAATTKIATDEPCLTLFGLRLVDASKMSWEQVLEMRKDAESVRKLRDLRLFLSKEYGDTDVERIRDDIERRLDEHDSVARKWGGDLRDASLSLLLGKEVQLSAAVGFGLLSAQLYYEALSAAAPILLQLGKIGLEISMKRRDAAFKTAHDPLAYLLDLKKSASS